MLSERDVRLHLERINVIRKEEEDDIIMNEKNLIANRLHSKNILINNSMFIYPKHCNSFCVDWYCAKARCHHPDHDPSHRSYAPDCHQAAVPTCLKIEGFPVGGK